VHAYSAAIGQQNYTLVVVMLLSFVEDALNSTISQEQKMSASHRAALISVQTVRSNKASQKFKGHTCSKAHVLSLRLLDIYCIIVRRCIDP